MHGYGDVFDSRGVGYDSSDQLAEFFRCGVAHGIWDIEGGRTRFDSLAQNQVQELRFRAASIFGWWDAVYFSTVTFTTLGYGDYWPLGVARLLAGAEALLGAFLMATFVVTLARRYMR